MILEMTAKNEKFYKDIYCYGDISYHTPKMDSSNLNILCELARSGKTTSRFLQDIWQTNCKSRTATTSFVWLPFSANTITSDVSSHGIGACILHKTPDGSKKPVAHASCSLLPSEKHYSQIKKEALAIIFAVTIFHRYLHGRFFKLQTDHKPLLTIFGSKKGLPVYTANRLLRWGTILITILS